MRTIYIADDGKEFDNEIECQIYEDKIAHPALSFICVMDKEGRIISDLFDEDTYSNAYKILVPTQAAADDIQWLADYTGFACYEVINSPGIWNWVDPEDRDGYFEKETD